MLGNKIIFHLLYHLKLQYFTTWYSFQYLLLSVLPHSYVISKENWNIFCRMSLKKDKVNNLSFYLDLLRNSRRSYEIHTQSWPTLSGLAVSLHEPKLCDFFGSVPVIECCQKLKINSFFLFLINVVLPSFYSSRHETRSIDSLLWRSFH